MTSVAQSVSPILKNRCAGQGCEVVYAVTAANKEIKKESEGGGEEQHSSSSTNEEPRLEGRRVEAPRIRRSPDTPTKQHRE